MSVHDSHNLLQPQCCGAVGVFLCYVFSFIHLGDPPPPREWVDHTPEATCHLGCVVQGGCGYQWVGGRDMQEPESPSCSLCYFRMTIAFSATDCFFYWRNKAILSYNLLQFPFASFTPSYYLTVLLPSSPNNSGT